MNERNGTTNVDLAAVQAALNNAPSDPPGLYVVATPIGNLADVTLRSLRILARADIVACEDTRVTRKLMTRYGLSTRLLSYHEHNAEARRPELMDRLANGEIVALASDAGTPMVSDPGSRLVAAAISEGYPIFALPGASALLAALVVAGLPSDRFWFEGFLPSKATARRARIAELSRIEGTLVLFEAPHRVAAVLADLSIGLGARSAVLARELTKRFETIRRAPLDELAAQLANESTPKGEIVLVIGPGTGEELTLSDEEIDTRLTSLVADLGVKRAAAQLAVESGLKSSDLYRRAVDLKTGSGRDTHGQDEG